MKKGEILTHPRNKYSAAEMEYALLELALMNDNLARTARKVGIDSGTLGKWRNKYAERYEDIKARVAPMVEKQIVAQARINARKAAEVAEHLLDKVDEDGLSLGDRAQAAKAFNQVSIGMGVQIDKTLLLEGRPTEILETRDAQAMLKELAEIAPGLTVDGHAIDVTPQELPAP
jgi:hypothetical protein